MRLDNFINFNEAKKVIKDNLLEDINNVFAYLLDDRRVTITKINVNNIKVFAPSIITSKANEYNFDSYEKSVVDWAEIVQDISVAIKQLKMMDNSIEIKLDTTQSDITINIFKDTNIILKENSVNINVSRRLFLKELNLPEYVYINTLSTSSSNGNIYMYCNISEEFTQDKLDKIILKANKIISGYGHVDLVGSVLYRQGLGFRIILIPDIIQKFSDGTNRKNYRGVDLKKRFKLVI